MWIPEGDWRYVSATAMRAADRYCIEELGMPGAVLMYNAGCAVMAEVSRGPVGIVCGKGNNGGDGFVVGIRALVLGLETHVVVLAEAEALQGDARCFHDVYVRLGGAVVYVSSDSKVPAAMENLSSCEIIVDAILGTGFVGAVRGLALAAISHWPERWTVAVDVPSGLDVDTGVAAGACVRADVTVALQAAKVGFKNAEARAWLGRVQVADIGIPAMAFGRKD